MTTFIILIFVAILAYVIYAVSCTIKCAKLDSENKKLIDEMNRKYGGMNDKQR